MTVKKVKKVCGTKVNRAKLQQVFHKLGLSLFYKSAVLHFV